MSEEREARKWMRQERSLPGRESALSRWRHLVNRWIPQLALGLILLTAARMMNAQGCAMCYNDAAAASAGAIHALRSGILVLITPPLGIFAAIFAVAYRNRNRFNGVGSKPLSEEDRLLRRSG